MEAAIKLARQYYLEKQPSEPSRTRFIARDRSYHGMTMGALAVGHHKERRAKFESTLQDNVSHVSPCYAYRDNSAEETDEEYVQRLATELDREFVRVGPETVCAFVAEPVSGAVRYPSLFAVSSFLDCTNTLKRLSAVFLLFPGTSKPSRRSAISMAPC